MNRHNRNNRRATTGLSTDERSLSPSAEPRAATSRRGILARRSTSTRIEGGADTARAYRRSHLLSSGGRSVPSSPLGVLPKLDKLAGSTGATGKVRVLSFEALPDEKAVHCKRQNSSAYLIALSACSHET